jgi:hypothetical protein
MSKPFKSIKIEYPANCAGTVLLDPVNNVFFPNCTLVVGCGNTSEIVPVENYKTFFTTLFNMGLMFRFNNSKAFFVGSRNIGNSIVDTYVDGFGYSHILMSFFVYVMLNSNKKGCILFNVIPPVRFPKNISTAVSSL